jgi:hypothetical protein
MAQRIYSATPSGKNTFPFRIALFLSLVVCSVLGSFSGYKYFRVVNVVCTQDGTDCSDEIKESVSHVQNRSMFEDFSLRILGKKIQIQKKYPQTLMVTVENQEILSTLFLDTAKQQRAILYTDGSVEKVTTQELSTSSASLAITDLTLSALNDVRVLSPSRFAVYTDLLGFAKNTDVEEIIVVRSDEIVIHTRVKLTAYVSSDALRSQLHSLQLLLASPTIERKPARVDLRFDRPVLQYY